MIETQGDLTFGGSLDEVVAELKAQLDQAVGEQPYRLVPEVTPRAARRSFPAGMSVSVQHTVKAVTRGSAPYGHQFDAWEHVYAGRSVVLTTPTASGKTLAFNPPILDAVLNQDASALFVYPLIDLATSQLDALQRLVEHHASVDPSGRRADMFSWYTGGAPKDQRAAPVHRSYVLITPESLHMGLLPSRVPAWTDFFRRLRFVVLDEAHIYAGIFGTNMAFILRRLVHRCLVEGGQVPQFILCSATIRKPLEFAATLLPPGIAPLAEVSSSSSTAPSPARHEIALLAGRTTLVDLFIRLLTAEVVDDHGKRRPVRTICFINSRKGVTSFVGEVREGLRRLGRPELRETFMSYKAGDAGAAQTFRRLMRGELSSIVTTNKLMAGIDIGELDVSIVYHFQRRFLDMRQMFGRAGRRGRGAWIFVGSPKSLEDQYVIDSFPEVFHCGDPEASIINPQNETLREAHLRCLNGTTYRVAYQEGPADPLLVKKLFGVDRLPKPARPPPTPWFASPVNLLQIRGSRDHASYTMELDGYVFKDDEGPRVPERLAFRDHHPGAIFEEGDDVYEVVELDRRGRRIVAKRARVPDLRTSCVPVVVPACTKELGRASRRGLAARHGKFTIRQEFAAYNVLKLKEGWQCARAGCEYRLSERGTCPHHRRRLRYARTWEIEASHPIVPRLELVLQTVGVQVGFSELLDGVTPRTDGARGLRQEALTGLRAVLVNAFPDVFLAEDNILGATERDDTIIFYDDFPGGLGASDALYADETGQIFRAALERLKKCKCTSKEGCLRCVQLPWGHSGRAGRKELVRSCLARLG